MECLLSVSAAFFNPSVQAVIPQMVDKSELAKANAKSQLISGITPVMGPVLGGLALSRLGYDFVFVFNGVSFFVSGALAAFLRIPPASNPASTKTNMKESLKEGYRYIFNRKSILVIITIVAIIHFFVGSIQVIIPVFSSLLAGDGAQNLGYLQTFFGLGVLTGALLLNLVRLEGREEKTMFRGIFAAGLILAFFGVMGIVGMHAKLPYFVGFFLFILPSRTPVLHYPMA